MKRNIILLGILIALLTLTYFLEKKRDSHAQEDLAKAQIMEAGLKFSDIAKIALNNASMVQKEGAFILEKSKVEASEAMLDDLLKRLSYLNIVRSISVEDLKKIKNQDLFDEAPAFAIFTFLDGEKITYKFGKKLIYDEAFYLEINRNGNKQLFVVQDKAPKEGIYQSDEEKDSFQYDELIRMLATHEENLFERQILKKIRDKISNSTIQIEGRHNRPFLVDFAKKQSLPVIFQGLSYNEEFFQTVLNSISYLTCVSIETSYHTHDLKEEDLLAKALIKTADHQEITLKLYETFKEKKGYYLLSSLNPTYLYVMDKAQSNLFFLNVENFWEKSIFNKDQKFGNHDEEIVMTFDSGEEVKILMPFAPEFKIESLTPFYKAKLLPLKKLMQMMIGSSSPQSSFAAIRISPTNHTFDEEVSKDAQKNNLKLFFPRLNMKVTLFFMGEELIIRNENQHYRLHFLLGDKRPFDLDVSSFFYKEPKK